MKYRKIGIMGYRKFQLSDCRLSDYTLDFSSKKQIYKKI